MRIFRHLGRSAPKLDDRHAEGAAGEGSAAESSTASSERSVRGAFIAVLIGMAMVPLDMTAVATAAPALAISLGELSNVAWVVTAMALGMTISIPIMGRLSDMQGRRKIFQAAIVLFVIGSVASGLSQSLGQLIAARFVQGIGGGGLMTLSQIILGDLVSPRRRGHYMGYVGAMFAVVNITGPILGGFIVDHFTWRLIFFLNLPLGAVAMAVSIRFLPRTSSTSGKSTIAAMSVLYFTLTVAGGFLVLSWGGDTYPWRSPVILLLAAGTVLALVVFVLVQRKSLMPIFPRDLLRNRTFLVASGLGLATGVAMHSTILFVPVFLQGVSGLDATTSGLLLMVLMGSIIVSMIVSNRLITTRGTYKGFAVIGGVAMAVGLGLLGSIGAETNVGDFIGYLAIVGVGIGLVVQVPILVVQNDVPRRVMGAGTAGTLFFRQVGTTAGVAAAGALFAGTIARALAERLPGTTSIDTDRLLSDGIASVPSETVAVLRDVLGGAISDVFLAFGFSSAVLCLVLALLLPARPLRDSVETFPAP